MRRNFVSFLLGAGGLMKEDFLVGIATGFALLSEAQSEQGRLSHDQCLISFVPMADDLQLFIHIQRVDRHKEHV
jgi:hypothetical protein